MPTSSSSPKQEKKRPLLKIGHYVLGDTLGVGTFGKVKGESGQDISTSCTGLVCSVMIDLDLYS